MPLARTLWHQGECSAKWENVVPEAKFFQNGIQPGKKNLIPSADEQAEAV